MAGTTGTIRGIRHGKRGFICYKSRLRDIKTAYGRLGKPTEVYGSLRKPTEAYKKQDLSFHLDLYKKIIPVCPKKP